MVTLSYPPTITEVANIAYKAVDKTVADKTSNEPVYYEVVNSKSRRQLPVREPRPYEHEYKIIS